MNCFGVFSPTSREVSFRLFPDDERFGRNKKRCHGSGVDDGGTGDFGRVDYARFEHIDPLPRLGVKTVIFLRVLV